MFPAAMDERKRKRASATSSSNPQGKAMKILEEEMKPPTEEGEVRKSVQREGKTNQAATDDEWSEGYSDSSLDEDTSAEFYICEIQIPKDTKPRIQRRVTDFKETLEMLLKAATDHADDWNDVDRQINGRRAFPTFKNRLKESGLDWDKCTVSEDNELNVLNQLNRWSLEAPSLNLISDSNWVMANKYLHRSLSLMQLLNGIHLNSKNEFSREQAGLLASFLDHLIMIQMEQQLVAYGFAEQIEQLRKSAAAPLLISGEAAVLGNLSGDLGGVCTKAVEETLELIEEAVQKLNSVRFSNLSNKGSPLENLTNWRVLFESCLVSLGLDLVRKKHGEAIKLGVSSDSLNRLHEGIGLLFSAGDMLLLDYVAMHRTMAEITYMLGDAFTNGGAGMNDLSDETTNLEEMDFDMDFPWDKHNVPDSYDLDNPEFWLLMGANANSVRA